MIKFIKILLLLSVLNGCSLDNKSNIWTQKEKKIIKKKDVRSNKTNNSKESNKELNPNLKVKIKSKIYSNNNFNLNDNNSRRVGFNSDLKNKNKYKFSKIKDFSKYEADLIFDKDSIIFFESKGTIVKFDKNSKIIWKKNFYSKSEKKLNPLLFLSLNKNILIVVDNISNYYAINNNTGDLLWKNKNVAPFNSQIKFYKDNFFVTDYNNTIRCFSILNGKEIWNYQTNESLIKSQKKLSIAIKNNTVFFNNSIGDISAINIEDGILLWQQPTQDNLVIENSFLLKNSDLVISNESLYFSNNKNEFYSLDTNTGNLNWKNNINSNIAPIVINDIIFTISNEGFLNVLNSSNGKILKKTNLFDVFSEKKRKKISPEGFLVSTEKIYLTTNTGYILIIDIKSGKTIKYLKIDNGKISKPFVSNNLLYIIRENSIIRFK